ncbi:ABC transporter permease [Methylococcus sp. EFPC2]|uniref:ABC transporter permease n=1 Tax=Methylococcus sp. EFPC2 TaxID=2812648 RepID=UPI001968499E|nr:ABC transporter permease [Methylococcus sp. EFPC2]QSA97823.1 ABC transporter permease [Methylococcus sp. EFPC2]
MSSVRQATSSVRFNDTGGPCLVLKGDWLLDAAIPAADDVVAQLPPAASPAGPVTVDGSELGRWDSALMTYLIGLIDACRERGLQVDTGSLPEGVRGLLDLVYAVPERSGARRDSVKTPWLALWGEAGIVVWKDFQALVEFLGDSALATVALIRGRARFRVLDLWLNIQDCGPSALPIVTLISLLVGLILAFVGAVQLALFGAQIYIADLVGLGMTREMGALMTAIIMSGRTGAAYAAQLGTMNVNSEIAALRVMGIAPMEFLVLPRMLALIFIMPFLGLYADLMGIIGGGLVSVSFFDVSLVQYLDRTKDAVHLYDFLTGTFKCAVFGVLIAIAGCLRGIQCGRSSSAVGDAATSAVVTGIVFIVVADSIITLICNRLGI